jgi:hypothetical protein
LRTVPGLTRDVDPATSSIVKNAVVVMHEALGDAINGTDFDQPGYLLAAVIDLWPKITYAEGEGPLELAVCNAAAMPIRPEPSLAFHLQQVRETEPILLPVHRLGAALGISGTQAGLLIRAAVRLGHLEVVDASYRPGRVRRFRCLLEPSRLGRPR